MAPKIKQPRYPWDKWLARSRIVLRHGEHFKCQIHSMAVQARNAAAKRDLSISVFIDPEGLLTIQHKVRRPSLNGRKKRR